MNKKTVSGIVLTLLLIGMLPLAFNIQPVRSEPKTWTVDDDGLADFSSIQDAINSPLVVDGDIIYVHNGTYYENVVVDKTVALLGENESTTVIVGVEHSPVWESVISVRADDVKIANLAVMNGGHGIYLGARRSIVTDCVAYENNFGLTISSSSENYLRRNLLFNNSHNLLVLGFWSISDFIHDIDSSNYVNGKPVYYLINEQNLSINPATFPNIGYLGVVNSSNVQITNLSLSRNGDGLLVAFSPNTLVENVEATYNLRGISLVCSPGIIVKNCNSSYNNLGMVVYYSENVNIKENNISHNGEGIFLLGSNHNQIHHNNFIENYRYCQARTELSYHCDWDDGYPSGGNYWSDYNGTDLYSGIYQNETGYDWIGDTPYIIGENYQDNYPLIDPYVPEKQETRMAYRTLLGRYNELLSDMEALNSTLFTLLGNITDLQEKYGSLLTTVNDLQKQINSLNSTLQEQIHSLNSTLISGQEAVLNELVNTRNLLYVFITATITSILIATTVYFALRKPKTKP